MQINAEQLSTFLVVARLGGYPTSIRKNPYFTTSCDSAHQKS